MIPLSFFFRLPGPVVSARVHGGDDDEEAAVLVTFAFWFGFAREVQ